MRRGRRRVGAAGLQSRPHAPGDVPEPDPADRRRGAASPAGSQGEVRPLRRRDPGRVRGPANQEEAVVSIAEGPSVGIPYVEAVIKYPERAAEGGNISGNKEFTFELEDHRMRIANARLE